MTRVLDLQCGTCAHHDVVLEDARGHVPGWADLVERHAVGCPGPLFTTPAGVDAVGVDGVVLVGEVNPYGSDPTYALFDQPAGCAGHRLRRFLGLSSRRYLGLHRVNLCVDRWQLPQARDAAGALYRRLPPRSPRVVVVLLGARVATAFAKITEGGALRAWQRGEDTLGLVDWVCLPHPSGRSRAWNGPPGTWAQGGPVDRARQILARVAPRVAWGEHAPVGEVPR